MTILFFATIVLLDEDNFQVARVFIFARTSFKVKTLQNSRLCKSLSLAGKF